jgi:hypothetical protein
MPGTYSDAQLPDVIFTTFRSESKLIVGYEKLRYCEEVSSGMVSFVRVLPLICSFPTMTVA